MAKRSTEAMTRRHIWIEDETWERLAEVFGDSIGQSEAIRKILKTFFTSLDARAAKNAKTLHSDLDDIV